MSCARWFARASLLAILFAGLPAAESAAADRFCDPSFEDCRALLRCLERRSRVCGRCRGQDARAPPPARGLTFVFSSLYSSAS